MRIIIISLLSGALLVSLSRGEDVTLKLKRRPTPGDKAEIVVKYFSNSSFAAGSLKTTGERIVVKSSNDEVHALFDATRQIWGMSENGKITKAKYTVKSLKFSAKKGEEPKELLASGTKFTAELKDNKIGFKTDGKAVDQTVAWALDSVIEMNAEDKFDPDTIFKTKNPHAMGAEWNGDVNAAIKFMSIRNPGIQFDPVRSTCKGRIDRLEKVNGIDCAIFSGTIDLKISRVVWEDFADMEIKDGSCKLTTTITVPADPSLPSLGSTSTRKSAIHLGDAPDNNDTVFVDFTTEETKHETVKPLP